MKKLLITIASISFLFAVAWAGVIELQVQTPKEAIAGMVIQPVGGAPAACDTVEWTNTGEPDGDYDIFDIDGFKYVGQRLTPASETEVCAVDFILTYKTGTITGKTFRAYISTVDDDDLVTLTEADDSVAGVQEWDETAVKFEWSAGYTMSASTMYAIVITMDGTADQNHFAELERIDTTAVFPGGEIIARWLADLSVNGGSSGSQACMVVYTR